MSNNTITVRTERNGQMFQKTETAWVEIFREPLQAADADFVPAHDPDNMPVLPEDTHKMRRVPRVKSMRRALQLTQEEFAETYMIPIGTLRDWEQERSEPDAPAKAYLKVIAADPEGVARTLKASARPAAE